MRRILVILLGLALLSIGADALGEAPAPRALTLMIYMAGSDLESHHGAATADIQEMLASDFDPDAVNLLIMTGGSTRWNLSFSAAETTVIQLGRGHFRTVDRRPAANMGDAQTLTDFLRFGVENYPARDYALILWNHGGGPMEGVCFDELHDGDRLSLTELGEAFDASPFDADNPLAWIGFDACMMAAVETAHICADYARYMIASQETEPANGWDYAFLSRAGEVPDGAALGQLIVDAYMAGSEEGDRLTLSCVDLSRIGAVKRAMSDLFHELGAQMNAESFSALSNDRRDAKGFGRATTTSDYDLVDLCHLAQQYAGSAPEESAALIRAVERAVVYNSGNQENARGLSVYSPYYNKKYFTGKWLEEYQALNFPDTYVGYLSRYARYWLGDQLADWSDLAGRALPLTEENTQPLELPLTEEQQSHFADAKVVILRDQGVDDAYFKVYEIGGLQPGADGVLRAEYDYSGLFALDEFGNVMTDLYPFFLHDDKYLLVADLESDSLYADTVVNYTGSGENIETLFVNLSCTLDPQTGVLNVDTALTTPSDPDELTTGKQYVTLDPSQWPYIYLNANNFAYFLSRDSDGRILPYTQWNSDSIGYQNDNLIAPDGTVVTYSEWARNATNQNAMDLGYRYFSEVDNTRPWTLQFLKGRFGPQDLYAQFIVTDTQGVESATELIPLVNPALADSASFDLQVQRDEATSITLERISVINSATDSGLYLRFFVENNTDMTLSFFSPDYTLNQTSIDTSHGISEQIRPHSATHLTLSLRADDIPCLADTALRSIDLFPCLWLNGNAEAFNVFPDPVHIDFDRPLDLSSLHLRTPGETEVRAEIEDGDLKWQLLDLVEAEDGSLRGLLRFQNRGESARGLNLSYDLDNLGFAIINGCLLRDALQGSNFATVPAGNDIYLPITITRTMRQDRLGQFRDSVFDTVDGFDYWGIRTVERITLGWFVDDSFSLLDFPLEPPLALRWPETHPAAEAVVRPLLESDELSVALRSIQWVDGRLRLNVDVANTADEDLLLCVFDCDVDGAPASAGLCSETYFSDTQFTAAPVSITPAEGRHRMALEIVPADDESTGSDFDRLRLRFEYAAEGVYSWPYTWLYSWRDTSSAVIEPTADPREADFPLGADAFSVAPGAPLDDIDLAALLGGGPTLPEDPEQYAVTLTLPMPPEQLQAIDDVCVLLAMPSPLPDSPDIYLPLVTIPNLLLNGETSAIEADFCGLVAAWRGSEAPFEQSVRVEDGVTTFMPVNLELYPNAPGEEGDPLVLFRSIRLIDDAGGGPIGARSFNYELYADPDSLDRAQSMIDYLSAYRVTTLEDGALAPCEQWEYLGNASENLAIEPGVPMLEMRPAAQFDLCVVFNIIDEDGGAYAVMLPYEQAAVPNPAP